MKNYNGSHLSPTSSHHSISAKLTPTHPAPSSAKTPSSSDEPFTLQDLKQEYTKALNFIDKLKAEQNSIKNNLRMALDQKAQPPSPDNNSVTRNTSAQIKRNAGKETTDKRIMELEIENSELKSQVDTAMVRVAKLQREKQALQDKVYENDAQASSREFVSEIRTLSQEIKALKVKLQEVEEENIRLAKQKASGRSAHRPSQNLMRYVNYVSKLVSSMASTNFARSCYEERFPKENDAIELLESGQWEPVLLKSYKYITDLLINLNSLSTEEASYRNLEVAADTGSGSQIPSRYESRRNSPTSGKDNTNVDSLSRRIQPSQEGFRPQKLRFETLETLSLKSPAVREEDMGYTVNEGTQSSDYEQSKRNLQKIVCGIDENKGYKKPQKRHVRHYSSVIGGYKPTQDPFGIDSSTIESASVTKGIGNWDTRLGSGSVYSPAEENNYSVKTRRLNEVESRKSEEEVPQNYPGLKVKPARVERHVKEEEEGEDSGADIRVKKRVRQDRKDQYREKERRDKQEVYEEEPEEGEEVYRSEFVKSRMAAATKSQKEDRREPKRGEEENDRRVAVDNYTYVKKRSRENKEENTEKDYKSGKRREVNWEDRSRSPSVKEEETSDYETNAEAGYKGHRPQHIINESKVKSRAQQGVSEKGVDSFYRSRSLPKDEIIEEDQESDIENKRVSKKKSTSRTRGSEEREGDVGDSKQEMWDRKREELARANNKKGNNSGNTSMELKGQDFTTFSVSFGRTESKAKLSLSPSPKAVSGIMEIPRRKRVDHLIGKYDVITGQDIRSPSTAKTGERSPTVRFSDGEGKKLLSKKSGSMVDLGKVEAGGDKAK